MHTGLFFFVITFLLLILLLWIVYIVSIILWFMTQLFCTYILSTFMIDHVALLWCFCCYENIYFLCHYYPMPSNLDKSQILFDVFYIFAVMIIDNQFVFIVYYINKLYSVGNWVSIRRHHNWKLWNHDWICGILLIFCYLGTYTIVKEYLQ